MTHEEAAKALEELSKMRKFDEAISVYNNGDNKYTMKRRSISTSEFLDGTDIDEMIDELQSFKEEIAKLPSHHFGEVTNEIGALYDEIDSPNLIYYYYIPYTQDDLIELKNAKINTEFREWIYKKLYDSLGDKKENTSIRHADCKTLKLFMDGHIPWDILRDLTYSDCEL